MSFIESLSSLWRLKCTSINIEKGPQSVSFIERFFPLCTLFEVSIIGGSIYCLLNLEVIIMLRFREW